MDVFIDLHLKLQTAEVASISPDFTAQALL
jgi:hypothetical protein